MLIKPIWPAPRRINAFYTTRQGGVSQAPFDGFNLATHVGDQLEDVLANRKQLFDQACLPSEPVWLDQQHTDYALKLCNSVYSAQFDSSPLDSDVVVVPVADASWTQQPGLVSVVVTADCLPILITNQTGTIVSAIHAGWKGLAKGIVSKTIQAFPEEVKQDPSQLMAWIGPAISAQHFEVGQDVYDIFVKQDRAHAQFFQSKPANKYMADLPGLVKKELQGLGVVDVFGGDLCSFELKEQFYSYRRSGQTGRMACLIWIEEGSDRDSDTGDASSDHVRAESSANGERIG